MYTKTLIIFEEKSTDEIESNDMSCYEKEKAARGLINRKTEVC